MGAGVGGGMVDGCRRRRWWRRKGGVHIETALVNNATIINKYLNIFTYCIDL